MGECFGVVGNAIVFAIVIVVEAASAASVASVASVNFAATVSLMVMKTKVMVGDGVMLLFVVEGAVVVVVVIVFVVVAAVN